MRKNKGQIEMIGLVIIVFLLALGILFMTFVSRKESSAVASISPQNVELEQNTIDAIKNIDLACPPPYGKKVGVVDIVADIAQDNRIYCFGLSSDEYLERSIRTILDKTLVNWSKPFVFRIVKDEGKDTQEVLMYINNLNCTESRLGQGYTKSARGEQTIPLRSGAGTATMSLRICG